MHKFLCFFGVHQWVYKTETSKFGVEIETRKCVCCHKEQFLDIHCLGLNPTEFVYTWIKVR